MNSLHSSILSKTVRSASRNGTPWRCRVGNGRSSPPTLLQNRNRVDPYKESIFIARMALQVGRYRDMADAMKQVARLGGGFDIEERNLLSTAYQSLTGVLRTSLKSLSPAVKEIRKKRLIERYTKQVESELQEISMEVYS